MNDPRFPPVRLNSGHVPYAHPQFIPGSPHRLPQGKDLPRALEKTLISRGAASDGLMVASSGTEPMPMPGAVPTAAPANPNAVVVRDPHHYSNLNTQAVAVANGVSAQFATAPVSRRNMLLIRNTSAAANIYIEFGRDATTASVLRLAPNDLAFFDVVVPQDDLYAVADAAAGTLSFSQSTVG